MLTGARLTLMMRSAVMSVVMHLNGVRVAMVSEWLSGLSLHLEYALVTTLTSPYLEVAVSFF